MTVTEAGEKLKRRKIKKAEDFAQCMKDLVDIHYPDAHKIHVVMDNYSTHKAGSLYKAFAPEEALRILKRLEFHYTPKHASWLNMVEIEIGNMNQQCLDRRIQAGTNFIQSWPLGKLVKMQSVQPSTGCLMLTVHVIN